MYAALRVASHVDYRLVFLFECTTIDILSYSRLSVAANLASVVISY